MKLLRTAGALLFAGLTTAACTAADAPARPTPAARPSASTPAAASPTPTPSARPLTVDRVVSDGLTVRYQGRDGRIETLRVEDFRR
nr:hypothetical protein [uncultured Friedmanniella sp.]